LPVAIRLPDAQGWVIAQKDADLSYCAGDGDWTAIGHNAALLPDATTVHVVRNGQPHEVPLTRR
jgi:hypothetical protein